MPLHNGKLNICVRGFTISGIISIRQELLNPSWPALFLLLRFLTKSSTSVSSTASKNIELETRFSKKKKNP